MDENRLATGVTEAVVADILLRLGVDANALLKMSDEDTLSTLRAAAARQDITQAQVEGLRSMGVPL